MASMRFLHDTFALPPLAGGECGLPARQCRAGRSNARRAAPGRAGNGMGEIGEMLTDTIPVMASMRFPHGPHARSRACGGRMGSGSRANGPLPRVRSRSRDKGSAKHPAP